MKELGAILVPAAVFVLALGAFTYRQSGALPRVEGVLLLLLPVLLLLAGAVFLSGLAFSVFAAVWFVLVVGLTLHLRSRW
ncbi:hypothetical protein LRS13_04705 [Svornostia abyssi]|uniref:Uncharacterized protein n=1 Tax=Svornostia abyssi TaxID=2898438 RepID=A0ABY5PJP0_9ACTN|nr:hypothetical protein LRS13_04705 [Parviterribacteraceae bacterium J379]